jgi:membrane protein YdbS with pleckstrin-like domain
MLSQEEEDFLIYWEQNKDFFATPISKLLRGLPVASLLGVPILLLLAYVYFFNENWYIKISKTAPSTYVVVILAVFIFIFGFAYIRMHFKWEMNEQLYNELKYLQKKEDAAKKL